MGKKKIKDKNGKIKAVKYLAAAYYDDCTENWFEAYKENGEKVENEYFNMLYSFE